MYNPVLNNKKKIPTDKAADDKNATINYTWRDLYLIL